MIEVLTATNSGRRIVHELEAFSISYSDGNRLFSSCLQCHVMSLLEASEGCSSVLLKVKLCTKICINHSYLGPMLHL